MKKLIFVLLFLLPLVAFSQLDNNPIIFTEVVKVDSNSTKNDLFNAARAWFNTAFVSSKDVLQIIDKENGELSGKGVIKYSNGFPGSETTYGEIRFSVSVFVKEGRYKYEFANFIHEGSPHDGYGAYNFGLITNAITCNVVQWGKPTQKWKDKIWNDIKSRINETIPQLIASLKDAMSKKLNTDW
jgi:hypothetical protein